MGVNVTTATTAAPETPTAKFVVEPGSTILPEPQGVGNAAILYSPMAVLDPHPEDELDGEEPMSDLLANCTNLDDYNRDQIRALAKERGIVRDDQNRDELIARLRESGMIA